MNNLCKIFANILLKCGRFVLYYTVQLKMGANGCALPFCPFTEVYLWQKS